jgi:hypothetical protein
MQYKMCYKISSTFKVYITYIVALVKLVKL